MMKRIENKLMAVSLLLILFSIIMGRVGLIYQGFVFSPRFHGGFLNACKVLFSWEQAKAYFRDPTGIVLFLLMVIPAAAGFIIIGIELIKTNKEELK